jgi:translocation and assembly module TamA
VAEINVTVQVQGIDKTLEKNVRLFLSIEQQKTHASLNEGRLRRLHDKAMQEIKLALQPYGFYKVVVQAELKKITDNSWSALYRIDPGPAIKIGEFNFRVNPEVTADERFAGYLKKLPLKAGSVFIHEEYEQVKANMLRLAAERGFFDAKFSEHKVEIDLALYQARVELLFEGGMRYVYGDVQITNDILNPGLLDRYVAFKKGAPYQLEDLISLQQALNDSDYFQSVEVAPGEANRNLHNIPVIVNLKPRKKNKYSLGLGYGTDTGARASLGWEKPRINKRGHRFNSDLKISEIGESLDAKYSIPVLNPRTDRLVYSAGLINEKTDTSESSIKTLGVSLKQSKNAWRQTLSLDYQREDFTIAETEDSTSLLLPGVSWSRTWGSGYIYTIDGMRLDIDLRAASEELFSDVDLVQVLSGIKFIQKWGENNRIIARAKVGLTDTNNFDKLPSSVRFFAGGAQSVRGYSYNSLGPENDDGEVEGGKDLLVGSLELEHRISGKWGVALFYDIGNAVNDLSDELARGAGFGLRWQSPVGAVRVDLGSALSRDDDPWRLHINIGPDL